MQTYTREERFAVHHPEGSTEWTLAIKYVQLADAGTYECQVSGGADTPRVTESISQAPRRRQACDLL